VVVVVGGPEHVNRKLSALPLVLVLVHGVLKWLHHLVLKYVMLLHAAESSHDFLHWSRPRTFPGEFARNTSPASVSHSTLSMGLLHTRLHVVVVVPGVVGTRGQHSEPSLAQVVQVMVPVFGE
jgi:hypothetical protein